MKNTKTITILCLLASVMIAPFAIAESPTVLLKQGIYVEETEGDLDKAIDIYKQVLGQAAKVQRLASRATYQLGMCHLKKGEKEKAAQYFQQLISKYPTQKTLAKKAQKELATLQPPTAGRTIFTPVVERIIYTDETGKDCAFDLDTGKAFSFPQGLTRSSRPEKGIPWILENGIDFGNCAGRLQLWDMVAVEVEEEMWNSANAVKINSTLTRGSSKEFLPTAREEYTITAPYTYAFETREGGIGLLQILEKRNTYLKTRYKMLHTGAVPRTTTSPNAFTTVEAFLKAMIAGDTSEAMKFVRPGDAVAHQLEDITEMPNYETAQIASVHADNTKAFAVSNVIFTDNGQDNLLTFRLTKQRGLWVVEDVDMETSEKAKADLQAFLKKYPTAGSITRATTSDSTEEMMTQEGHNTIDADGLIHFQSSHRVSNNNTEPITTNRFINSDFVSLTKMYEEDGTAIPFETKHEGNIYRYKITFNKPIMPGETFVYYTEGTTSGLIKPVPGSKGVFRYSMVHSPATNQPVLRIETFLLPENAVFISTSTPGIQKTEKDGRIELRVEKVVPANGSIATEFQYEIPKPLKLDPAPWVDGEVMEIKLKRPGGKEYGTIVYSAQSGTVDDIETWQIIAHMHVTEGNLSQYTFVEAEAETFAPLVGQTTNWMGSFVAEYTKENVKLTANGTTKDHPVSTVVYDNEQALYLIRRMPLAEDYQGKFPIFPVQGGGGVTVECQIKVLAVEDVTVKAGTYTCYKTDLSIHYGGAISLQHTLWFSADEHKYLVKYDVGGAATMELAKVWQRQTDQPLTYENTKKGFSVSVPADWRFYKYGSKLQLMAPDLKPWALFMWQKRGTDPDSASALTIAKADFEKLKDSFTNYTVDQSSWTEFTLSGLQTAQYIATYQKSGTGLKAYPKPKEMIEYRTYIVDESTIYWFVFRVEDDDFEDSKDVLDYIIKSFKANEKI